MRVNYLVLNVLIVLNSAGIILENKKYVRAYMAPSRAVFVRFSLAGQSFDWRLATIAGMEVAKLVLWNSLLN